MHLAALSAALLSFSLLCASAPSPYAVLEKRQSSSGWAKRSKLPSGAHVPVRIALTQRNIDLGGDALLEISNPSSLKYGKHWTPEEVVEAFAPSETTIDATTSWLEDSGISRSRIAHTANRGYITFDATAGELESLLKTEYHIYQHSDSAKHAIACDEYHVPMHLKSHIDFITPSTALLSPDRKVKRSRKLNKRQSSGTCRTPPPTAQNFTLDRCSQGAFPECIRALYNIPRPGDAQPGNSFAIFELDQTYIQSDMDLFYQYVAPEIPVGTAPTNFLLNGAPFATNFTDNDAESNLDFQLAWPLVYPQNITLFDAIPSQSQLDSIVGLNLTQAQLGALAVVATLDDVLQSFDGTICNNATNGPCGIYASPKVLSVSYGYDELDVSDSQIFRLCNEFLKMGLQGTTVLIASGDGGVAAKDGTCLGPNSTIFNPSGLTSCPWITSVGATMIGTNNSVSDPEISALDPSNGFSSGGGFSNYFRAPYYQRHVLARYFNQSAPPYPSYEYTGLESVGANGGVFNRRGRGFPDVSALGTNILNTDGGCFTSGIDGTSASAPIFASAITLINAERLAAGKGSVGFINPTLYANPQVLIDITRGSNIGCGTNGFAAVKGWDPVTGLGTPNYPEMKSLFMSLP